MTNEEKMLDILASMQAEIQGMESRLTQRIEDTRTGIMTYIESSVEPKLQTLAEGHQTLLNTMVPRTRVDELEDKVKVLESVVIKVISELQELKQAN